MTVNYVEQDENDSIANSSGGEHDDDDIQGHRHSARHLYDHATISRCHRTVASYKIQETHNISIT